MRERDWRNELLLFLIAVALVSRLADILSELRLNAPGGFFGTADGVTEQFRQRRFQAFEPGLLLLSVAVLGRFAPVGRVRRVAGWVSVCSAALGLAAVAGIWVFEAFDGAEWGRYDIARVPRSLASLVVIGALAWWGSESIAAKDSNEVDAAELA